MWRRRRSILMVCGLASRSGWQDDHKMRGNEREKKRKSPGENSEILSTRPFAVGSGSILYNVRPPYLISKLFLALDVRK